MCPFRNLGIVCDLGLGGWLAKICFSGGFPCIRRIVFVMFVLFPCLRYLWLAKSGLIAYGEFGHYRPICQHM